MAKVHLNIEDVDGRIALQVQWRSDKELIHDLAPHDPFKGWDKDSAAHQMGMLCLKYLEALLVPLVEPEIITNENAPNLSLVRDVPILDPPKVETPGSLLNQ
jgi:hypothetical protein